MNNSCASTDGQSHNLFKLTKIGGIQPNFRNIAAHLPEYVDQSDSMQPIFLNMLTNQIRAWLSYEMKNEMRKKMNVKLKPLNLLKTSILIEINNCARFA